MDGLAGWLGLAVAYPPPKHTTLPVEVAPTPAHTARPALWDAGWLQVTVPCSSLSVPSVLVPALLSPWGWLRGFCGACDDLLEAGERQGTSNGAALRHLDGG
jgi:hypothetical protein